jgi:hypothetical protein
MHCGDSIRFGQPTDVLHIARKFQDAFVVNIVDHVRKPSA